MAAKKTFVPVVAVLNMKGGVGKTTITANVFNILFERKEVSTLLLDLDPQFNLTQLLQTRHQYDALKTAGRTMAAVMEPTPSVSLFQVTTSSQPPPSAASLIHSFWYLLDSPEKTLDMVVGDFNLVKYSLMDDPKKLESVKARFKAFIEAEKDNYGLIAIDCNPSSSFLTMCALEVCTHILVPVRPDRYSILGLEMLQDFVLNVAPINPKPHFVVVLNGVKRKRAGGTIDLVEAELRALPTLGKQTLANSIRLSNVLAAAANYTGFATDRKVAYATTLTKELEALVDELATKLGIK